MTAANTITGRSGCHYVDDVSIARTMKWEVNWTLATKTEWGDCDSGGYTNRAPGRIDGTYTSEGKYDTGQDAFDLFKPGVDYIESVLWLGASTTLYWHFPRAITMTFNMMVDSDTEEVIGWASSFGPDGIFYSPGNALVQKTR